jgi:hypothetical protein
MLRLQRSTKSLQSWSCECNVNGNLSGHARWVFLVCCRARACASLPKRTHACAFLQERNVGKELDMARMAVDTVVRQVAMVTRNYQDLQVRQVHGHKLLVI